MRFPFAQVSRNAKVEQGGPFVSVTFRGLVRRMVPSLSNCAATTMRSSVVGSVSCVCNVVGVVLCVVV